MTDSINRRHCLQRLSGCLAASVAAGSGLTAAATAQPPSPDTSVDGLNTYFGDLHNHNNVGYAAGSLERTYDIAASHLDFFAFTPHSHWHDVPIMEQDKQRKWLDGFEVTRKRWPDVQRLNRQYYQPGVFVTFPTYEWHSSRYGDFCIYVDADELQLTHFDKIEELKAFARENRAILIPHHPAYHRGNRGADPSCWDPDLTPLLEIYSEHGNAESDEGPLDYIRHSMGGRWTPNTFQAVLAAGHRVGALASSDDHLGYPGAYGEGLAAIQASELTRPALFDALRKRRTYGLTGDRIKLDFRLNGQPMGSELPYARDRKIEVTASGWDVIRMAEVIKNGRVIHRDFPVDRAPSSDNRNEPCLVRLEFGWGPWADLGIPRVCDWEFRVDLENGRLLEHQPCFQSGPLDEDRRNRVLDRSESGLGIKSYTSRLQAFAERPTNAVVLRIDGGPSTALRVGLRQPAEKNVRKTLAELMKSNEIVYTGPFPDESLLIHRAVPGIAAQTAFDFSDDSPGDRTDWYYVRVEQQNGHLAWSSPIWVEKRT